MISRKFSPCTTKFYSVDATYFDFGDEEVGNICEAFGVAYV
jgi:hypothetical protein